MYEKFYGLSVDPFRLSPDHRFSFSHSSYAKAKAYIQYALHRAEGFVMITGRPGTGKTTLVNEVLEGLSRTDVVVATLVSTQLEADDLLRMVAYSFGLDAHAPHKALVLQRLMDFLVRQHREGRRALLIIDEAQDLSVSALEELRLLTNLQRIGWPLLQIVLLGQESLRGLVRGPTMEQVHQRLVAACDLEPLGVIDTLAYVQHRLERAGWHGDPKINREVWPILYELSGGVPRRINLVCSRLLLHGCVEERHTLTAKDAAFVAAELQQEELAPMGSGADAEPMPARMSTGPQSTQQGREIGEQAQEEDSGRAREDPRKMLTDPPWAYVDEDVAWKLDGRREIGDTTREPGLQPEAAPAVVGDPQGSSASREGERPDWVSTPPGQRVVEYSTSEERRPHGRAGSRDGLPGDSGSRTGASQDEGAERPSGREHGSDKETAQVSRDRRSSRGGPRGDAVHTANANAPLSPSERESGLSATDRVRSGRPGGDQARRRWPTIMSLAVGLAALIGAVFYFRPNVLERELVWLEQRTASIPQTARALFSRLTGVHTQQGHEYRYEQPRHQVGDAFPGSTRPKPHSAVEEGLEDRRVGTRAPSEALRDIEK